MSSCKQKSIRLQKDYEKHKLNELKEQPIGLLRAVGGFEIAMMAGAYLEAAKQKMIVVVDGFITTAALLIANAIFISEKQPSSVPGYTTLTDHCIFAHTSHEAGHEKILKRLGVTPLLQSVDAVGRRNGSRIGHAIDTIGGNFS